LTKQDQKELVGRKAKPVRKTAELERRTARPVGPLLLL
jgi:hypothetical protein